MRPTHADGSRSSARGAALLEFSLLLNTSQLQRHYFTVQTRWRLQLLGAALSASLLLGAWTSESAGRHRCPPLRQRTGKKVDSWPKVKAILYRARALSLAGAAALPGVR
jgi:hypothetical protein